MNRLLEIVKADKAVLWFTEACGYVAYVRRDPRKDWPGRPFSVWEGGCGIGHARTLKAAKDLANLWLISRAKEDRKQILARLVEVDKFLQEQGLELR